MVEGFRVNMTMPKNDGDLFNFYSVISHGQRFAYVVSSCNDITVSVNTETLFREPIDRSLNPAPKQ